MTGATKIRPLPEMSRTEKARLILRALEQDKAKVDADTSASTGVDRNTLAAALSELVRDLDWSKKRKANTDGPPPPDHASSARDVRQQSDAPGPNADRLTIPVAGGGSLPHMPDLGIEHPLTAAQVIGRLPTKHATAILRQMPPVVAQQIVLVLDQGHADSHTPTALTEHASQIIRAMT